MYFFYKCRCALAVENKTLGGYRIAKAVKVLDHHRNVNYCLGVSFDNSILKIATKDGCENEALSSAIYAANGTAEIEVSTIQRTFSEDCNLLKNWRDVTCHMWPDRQDLLEKWPDPMKLKLARLAEHGWLLTDTSNTPTKFRKLIHEVIETETKENGMTEGKIKVYKTNCWHQIWNMWIEVMVLKLVQNFARY